MALNLKKEDDSNLDPSKKSNSKFDLKKSDTESTPIEVPIDQQKVERAESKINLSKGPTESGQNEDSATKSKSKLDLTKSTNSIEVKPEEVKSKLDLSKKDYSKSDLATSKIEDKGTVNNEKSKKTKTGIFIFGALILVGIVGWVVFSKSKHDVTGKEISQTEATEKADNATAVQNTVAAPTGDGSSPAIASNNAATNNAANINEENSNNATAIQGSEPNGANAKANNVIKNEINKSNTNTVVSNIKNKVPATFGKSSSSLVDIDNSLVKEIILFLKNNPNSTVNVDGYASSEGALIVNEKISKSRANSFKNHLVSKGISADKIITAGHGIENPIASNDTEEGRQKNRRVEITIK